MIRCNRATAWILVVAGLAGLLVGLTLRSLGNPYLAASSSLLVMCLVALVGKLVTARD